MTFNRSKLSLFANVIAMGAIAIIAIQYVYLCDVNFLGSVIPELGSLPVEASTFILYAAFLIICILIFLLGSLISAGLNKEVAIRENVSNAIKVFLSVMAIIVGIAFKLWYAFGRNALVSLRDESLYEISKISSGGFPSGFANCEHGITYVYVMLLYIFMLFLGNGAFSVVILQLTIQLISLLVLFGVGRRLFGYTTGIVSVLLYSFIPYINDKIFDATPGCLLTLVILIGLYLISLFYETENDEVKVFYTVIFGLIIGAALYLDASLFIVLVLWAIAFVYEMICYFNGVYEEEMNPAISYIVMLVGMIVGFAGAIVADGLLSNNSFDKIFFTWVNLTKSAKLPFFSFFDSTFGIDAIWINLILVGFAFMSTFIIFKKRQFDLFFLVIMLFSVALTPATVFGVLEDNSFSEIVYILLAGCGIRAMFMLKDKKEVIHAYDKAFEYIENSEKAEAEKKGIKATVEPAPGSEVVPIGKDFSIEEKVIMVEAEETNTSAIEADSVQVDEASKEPEVLVQVDDLPGMIKNPLPLPARRRHKQVDYGTDVAEDMMHFDIDVTDDDDFDV